MVLTNGKAIYSVNLGRLSWFFGMTYHPRPVVPGAATYPRNTWLEEGELGNDLLGATRHLLNLKAWFCNNIL